MGETALSIPQGMASHPAAMYLATLSPGSWRTMQSVLNRMAGLLGYADVWSCPWHELRFNTVLTLRAALLARGFAPETIKKMRSALLGTLRMAVKLKLMSRDDLDAIEFPSPGGDTPRPAHKRELSRWELLQMMRVCTTVRDRWLGRRDLAMMALMLGNGVRRAGVADALLAHYDRRRRALQVRGKGNKWYEAQLEPGVVLALEAWLAERGDEPGPLFTARARPGRTARGAMDPLTPEAVYRMVTRRARQAGLKDVTPHTFRYTCATRLLKGGVSAVLVQRVLAHSHLSTTQRYFCVADDDVRTAAAGVPIPLPGEFVRERAADARGPKPRPQVAGRSRPPATRRLPGQPPSRTARKLDIMKRTAKSRGGERGTATGDAAPDALQRGARRR